MKNYDWDSIYLKLFIWPHIPPSPSIYKIPLKKMSYVRNLNFIYIQIIFHLNVYSLWFCILSFVANTSGFMQNTR